MLCITNPKTCLDLRQNRSDYLRMLRVRYKRPIFLLLVLAVSLALGIGHAAAASPVMSLEVAKSPIAMGRMSAAHCEASLTTPCDSEPATCMVTCNAPILGIVVVAFYHAPQSLGTESARAVPYPLGITRTPNLPPPRTTDI